MDRYGGLDPDNLEFLSVEAFAEHLFDEDVGEFDWRHLSCLNTRLQVRRHDIRLELESYGLTLADRPKERRTRTYSTNPHDRWYGPGADRTHGGSGWRSILKESDPG